MQTCIHTYIQTYIYTYIHTYICIIPALFYSKNHLQYYILINNKKDRQTKTMVVYIRMLAKDMLKSYHNIFQKLMHQLIYLFKIHFRINKIILKLFSTFVRKFKTIIF